MGEGDIGGTIKSTRVKKKKNDSHGWKVRKRSKLKNYFLPVT